MPKQIIRRYSIPDDEPCYEGETIPFRTPLELLYGEKSKYADYPEFQREANVWPYKYKFDLIRSAVKKSYIPAILTCRRLDGQPGNWVIDGQQRLETLLRFVAALKADKAGLSIPKDEDGKPFFYFRLKPWQEENLLNCKVRFEELQNPTPELIANIYLALQNQVSSTTAEKLWAMRSRLNDETRVLYFQSEFVQAYAGRAKRRQKFQFAAYPLLVNMFKPFVDMHAGQIEVLMRGTRDSLITDGLTGKTLYQLEQASRLFKGVTVSAMTEAIIMSQAVWLLDFIGCDLPATPDGALLQWYRTVERENTELRNKKFMNLFASFTATKIQKEYWRRWLDDIVYGNMIVGASSIEVMSQKQRVTGWIDNNGYCFHCQKLVPITSVKNHVFKAGDQWIAGTCSYDSPRESLPAVLTYTR